MRSISPKIQIWEVGATAEFMISLIQWSGAGISVGKLLSGYRSCALQSRCNRLQVERHMRYFCAVIDALYTHQILDSLEKEDAEPPLLAVKDEDTDADQPLAYIRELMDGTWLQWCYEQIVASYDELDFCDPSPGIRRLYRRLTQTPRPYYEDVVQEEDEAGSVISAP